MTKRLVTVTRTTDGDGRAIALVPLAGSDEPAKLFTEDYEALMRAGLTSSWDLNRAGPGHRYVRAYHICAGNGRVTIARLIAGAGKGKRVKHADGNPLNLRRDNLFIRDDKRVKDGFADILAETAKRTFEPARMPTEEELNEWAPEDDLELPPLPLKTTVTATSAATHGHGSSHHAPRND